VSFGLLLSKRVFSTWFVWCQEPDGSFTVAFAPMSDYKRLNSSTTSISNALESDAAAADAIRGSVKGFWRIVPLSPEGERAARPRVNATDSDHHLSCPPCSHRLSVYAPLLTHVCGPQSARSRTSSRRKSAGPCPER